MRVLVPSLLVVVLSAWAFSDLAVKMLFEYTPVVEWAINKTQYNKARMAESLSDGDLHVVFCGSGSPIAEKNRAGSCVAVLAGENFLVFDVGPTSPRNLNIMGLPIDKINGVFLSHFHSDHMGGLGELVTQSWIAGRNESVIVYGGEGVEDIVRGFERAYQHDVTYRMTHHNHHGNTYMPRSGGSWRASTIQLSEEVTSKVAYDDNGIKVTAFKVNHYPVAPAYGYRVDFKGKSVVISGDTTICDTILEHSMNVDVLIHEAIAFHVIGRMRDAFFSNANPRMANLLNDIQDYHSSPSQVVEMAKTLNVGALVLTHMVPPSLNKFIHRANMLGVDSSDLAGDLHLAEDGLHLTISTAEGSTKIKSSTIKF